MHLTPAWKQIPRIDTTGASRAEQASIGKQWTAQSRASDGRLPPSGTTAGQPPPCGAILFYEHPQAAFIQGEQSVMASSVRYADRRVLITGGGSGIGDCTCCWIERAFE